jgi:DNA replication protein DnaC
VATARDESCPICRGTGWAIERREGREVAVRCRCRAARQESTLLAASRIPPRYGACTLDNFDPEWDPGSPSLPQALRATRAFVADYPQVRRGLLFMGPVGIGKTHLAVAALREIVLKHGARGIYVNFLELVQALQMSFDGGTRTREEIMSPVIEADLVVLDELGAGKLTPWVMDLMYLVINSRYSQSRITLATSNFLDTSKSTASQDLSQVQTTPSRTSAYTETLADRIGAPARSRLYEMCDFIDMRGAKYGGDYRRFRKLQEWQKS